MKLSIRKGFGFGLTSGIITTLGMIVGLHAGTHSQVVVLGGILVIAVADAFSDALGMHMSEEFESRHTSKDIWASTVSTFWAKLLFALTFLAPVLLFPLLTAIIISVVWGLFLIAVFSYRIAKRDDTRPLKVVAEHLAIAVLVIIITHYVGDWVATLG